MEPLPVVAVELCVVPLEGELLAVAVALEAELPPVVVAAAAGLAVAELLAEGDRSALN